MCRQSTPVPVNHNTPLALDQMMSPPEEFGIRTDTLSLNQVVLANGGDTTQDLLAMVIFCQVDWKVEKNSLQPDIWIN